MFFLIQSRRFLAFCDTRAHGSWLIFNLSNRVPRSFLAKQFSNQSAACTGMWVIPMQVQEFIFLFAVLHEIPFSPFFQPVEIPLNISTTLWFINCFSEFFLSSKLAENVFCLIIQLTKLVNSICPIVDSWGPLHIHTTVLDCCCPPVLFLQEILGLFKFPMSIMAWKSEITWRLHLHFPDQVSCSRHTQLYQPLWPDL